MLPKLPKAPRTPKPKDHACGCGCGTMVARRFAPGHDSRLHARVLRIQAGIDIAPFVTEGELAAAKDAATFGPRRKEDEPQAKAPKPETKKARKERERQAKIAAQLAAIAHPINEQQAQAS